MTLEQLRVFVATANDLNMTRAAKRLNLTQPAISAAIAALEARHAIQLFNRIGRKLELTETGRLFLHEAREIIARVDHAQRRLHDLSDLLSGEVRLAASQTVATYWLPPRMARFAGAYPGIALPLAVGNTAQTVDAVLSGRADIGVIEGTIDEPVLVSRRVGGDRLGLFAAPQHPLVGRPLVAQDLRDAVWVLRETGSGTLNHLAACLADAGIAIADLNVRLELPSNGAVLEAVAVGGLVTAVSTMAVTSRLASGSLRGLDYNMPQRDFLMLTHSAREPGHAAQAFIASLLE